MQVISPWASQKGVNDDCSGSQAFVQKANVMREYKNVWGFLARLLLVGGAVAMIPRWGSLRSERRLEVFVQKGGYG